MDSSAMWGKQTMHAVWIKNRNPGPPSAETKMDIGLATRTMTKIVTGNARNPKRVTVNMDQISLADAILNA